MAGGDPAALSDLYDESSRYVHTIALRILRDPDEAEEITLDVFQQAWRLAPSYDAARCSVASWLGMLARSRALDRWRVLQSRRRLIAVDIDETANIESPQAGPELAAEQGQRRERLHSALRGLPPDQMEMIRLAFWEGLTHSEVAARTGVPLGTVKTRIRLGMLKLREALDDVQPA